MKALADAWLALMGKRRHVLNATLKALLDLDGSETQ